MGWRLGLKECGLNCLKTSDFHLSRQQISIWKCKFESTWPEMGIEVYFGWSRSSGSDKTCTLLFSLWQKAVNGHQTKGKSIGSILRVTFHGHFVLGL
jgi:hypothetical protein